jgi:hypothetical protein
VNKEGVRVKTSPLEILSLISQYQGMFRWTIIFRIRKNQPTVAIIILVGASGRKSVDSGGLHYCTVTSQVISATSVQSFFPIGQE